MDYLNFFEIHRNKPIIPKPIQKKIGVILPVANRIKLTKAKKAKIKEKNCTSFIVTIQDPAM